MYVAFRVRPGNMDMYGYDTDRDSLLIVWISIPKCLNEKSF